MFEWVLSFENRFVCIVHNGRARKARSGWKDATRNRTLGGTREQTRELGIVLRSTPSSCRTFLTPIRSCIHLTRGIHTPPTRCFPVKASRRAKRRVTRVFVGEQLETQSNGSLIVFPPVLFVCQASRPRSSSGAPSIPTGTTSTFTALPVIEGGCSWFCRKRNFATHVPRGDVK